MCGWSWIWEVKLWGVRICHEEVGMMERDSVAVARVMAIIVVDNGIGGFIVVHFRSLMCAATALIKTMIRAVCYFADPDVPFFRL